MSLHADAMSDPRRALGRHISHFKAATVSTDVFASEYHDTTALRLAFRAQHYRSWRHTCSLTNLMAFPMDTDRGRHSTRNWMAVLSWWVRSLDNTLPSGVTYSCASRPSSSSQPKLESQAGNTRLHHITLPVPLHGSFPESPRGLCALHWSSTRLM